MKSRRKWVTFAAWIPFIIIFIGLGCMGLWANVNSRYVPDEEYLKWATEHEEWYENGMIGEPPPSVGLPESQRSLSFWSSIGFIVVSVLIAVIIFVPVILSVL